MYGRVTVAWCLSYCDAIKILPAQQNFWFCTLDDWRVDYYTALASWLYDGEWSVKHSLWLALIWKYTGNVNSCTGFGGKLQSIVVSSDWSKFLPFPKANDSPGTVPTTSIFLWQEDWTSLNDTRKFNESIIQKLKFCYWQHHKIAYNRNVDVTFSLI